MINLLLLCEHYFKYLGQIIEIYNWWRFNQWYVINDKFNYAYTHTNTYTPVAVYRVSRYIDSIRYLKCWNASN